MLDSEKERLDISCSLNLASCRLRAEALARQLHSKLWTIGRFELADRSYCGGTCLQRYAAKPKGSEPIIDKPPQSKRRQYGANNLNSQSCWNSEAMISSDDDEGYEPGDCSSPPSPADEEIVLNPPISMPPVPSSIETSPPLEEVIETPPDYMGASGSKAVSSAQENCKIPDKEYGRMLCEKLQKYADSWTDYYVENNNVNHVDATQAVPEKVNRFEVVAVVSSCQVGDNAVQSTEGRFTVTPCEPKESVCPSQTECNAVPTSVNRVEEETPKRHEKGQLYLNVDVDEGRRPLIRSTSLKTGKTPPGTPRTKKIVRFADVLGLDLEAVKHIVSDDLPIIPQSAFTDLKIPTSEPLTAPGRTWAAMPLQNITHAPSYSLYPQFQQPYTAPDFTKRVHDQKVCLESIMVDDMTVHCVVRVSNIAYEKMVYARYTTTEWATCEDVLASYVPGSTDSFSDKFSFNIYVPHLAPGQRLCFALRYVAAGQEYWDNNRTSNYVLRCCSNSQVLPLSQEGSNWLHHFM